MNAQEFIDRLNNAQDLISQEKFKDANGILEDLREIEKKGDFNYSLTHKLYQLISNSRSLYNQQVILKYIGVLSKNKKSITFHEINVKIKNEVNIDELILKREIELLILRGLLQAKITGNEIIFWIYRILYLMHTSIFDLSEIEHIWCITFNLIIPILQ